MSEPITDQQPEMDAIDAATASDERFLVFLLDSARAKVGVVSVSSGWICVCRGVDNGKIRVFVWISKALTRYWSVRIYVDPSTYVWTALRKRKSKSSSAVRLHSQSCCCCSSCSLFAAPYPLTLSTGHNKHTSTLLSSYHAVQYCRRQWQ